MILDFWASLGNIAIGILAFIFVLGTIILIHEGGHFYFASKAGVLCREYAFGMGPQIVHKKKGETDYAIRVFPIGGFCAIAGEESEDDPLKDKKEVRLLIENDVVKKICFEVDCPLFSDLPLYSLVDYDILDMNKTGSLFMKVSDEKGEKTYTVDAKAMFIYSNKGYKNSQLDLEAQKKKYILEFQNAPYDRQLNSKKLGQRAMVIFGGPMMNILLAIVVFFISSLIMGVSKTDSTILNEVSSGSAAYAAGLRENDEIYRLTSLNENNELIDSGTITDWKGISDFMDLYRNDTLASGPINVYYYENSDKNVTKQASVNPMVMIYSISMLEDINSNDVKIAALATKSKAYIAGLREGDIILSVNGVETDTWKDVYNQFALVKEAKQEVNVKVNRDGEVKEFTVVPYSEALFAKTQSVNYVDIQIGISPIETRNIIKCFTNAFVEMYDAIKQLLNTLWMLIASSEVGIKDLSGVVGIFSMTSEAAKSGFGYLLYWMGFLSVNVGFMNLLPIPALDGGRLVFLAIEGIRKKPVAQKVQDLSINVTMILLLILMVYVAINDFIRIF